MYEQMRGMSISLKIMRAISEHSFKYLKVSPQAAADGAQPLCWALETVPIARAEEPLAHCDQRK